MHLKHDDQKDDEDFEISLSQKFEREKPKNDSSENDVDVDGDPPDVLTPPYIPTMKEHCFMYNHDVYLVQVLKLCGHLVMDVQFYEAWGRGTYTHLNSKKVRLMQEFLCPTIFVLLTHHSLFQGQGLN